MIGPATNGPAAAPGVAAHGGTLGLRLARMVGDLQTLAAAESAAPNLARRPCDLADLAAAAAARSPPRAAPTPP